MVQPLWLHVRKCVCEWVFFQGTFPNCDQKNTLTLDKASSSISFWVNMQVIRQTKILFPSKTPWNINLQKNAVDCILKSIPFKTPSFPNVVHC